MDRLQLKNLREIEGLNQRGGRTLSFIDLIAAGTMSAELVAHCWAAISRGASFFTAAQPSGAGKSTVLANLLICLPPREEVVTVSEPDVLDDDIPNCYLAHEIGSGHWYGYIWGRQVVDFLALIPQGRRIASCIHADTLEEMREIMTRPPLEVPVDHFNMIDLILFVHRVPAGRRVVAAWESIGDGHRLAFEYDEDSDAIVRNGPSWLLTRLGVSESDYHAKLGLVRRMVADGEAHLADVREKVLAGYG